MSRQADINRGWALFNKAIEALEEVGMHFDDLSEEYDIDCERASDAICNAREALDAAYSHGSPILPPHSNDKPKRKRVRA